MFPLKLLNAMRPYFFERTERDKHFWVGIIPSIFNTRSFTFSTVLSSLMACFGGDGWEGDSFATATKNNLRLL